MNSYIKNKQRWAILREYEKQILNINNTIPHKSGIYLFYRYNENDEPCVYIGQSIDILRRCAEHCCVKAKDTHIDKSLYKHGLYSKENTNGWKVKILIICSKENLDYYEKQYIDFYNNDKNFIVYNVTGGGQIDKETDINKRQEKKLKSYKNGKNLGAEKVKEQIRIYFEKYLDVVIKGKSNKIKERKLEEFIKFIEK